MQIQNVEALKAWLTGRLEKICDADPAALAKYVVALVKKDKPNEELKKVCIDQLEVFLSNETSSFVTTLFDVLQTGCYLPSAIGSPVASVAPAVPALPPSVSATAASSTVVTSNTDASSAAVNQEKPRKASVSEDPAGVRHEGSVIDDDERDFRRTRRPAEEDAQHPEASSSVVSSTAERKRKRHSEDETNRRSKSSRDDHDRQRKIEQNRHIDEDHRRKEEEDRRRRGDGRNDRRRDERHSPHAIPTSSQENDRMDRSSPLRDRSRGNRAGYRGRRPDNDRERMGPRGPGGFPSKRMRCRDYDEKGFCMRGELCQFDHGNDPVVVGDLMPSVLGMQGQQPMPMPYIPDGPPPAMPPYPPRPSIPAPNMVPRMPMNIPPNSMLVPTSQSQPPPPGTNDPSAGKRPPPSSQDQPKVKKEGAKDSSVAQPPSSVPAVPPQPGIPEIRPLPVPAEQVMHVPRMPGPAAPHPGMQGPRGAPFDMPMQRPPMNLHPRMPAMQGSQGMPMGMPRPRHMGIPPTGSGSESYNPEQPSFDRPSNQLPMWARLGTVPPGQVAMMQNMRTRELVELTSQPPVAVPPQLVQDASSAPPDMQRTVLPPHAENRIHMADPINSHQGGSNNPTVETKPFRPFKTTLELRKVPKEYNNITKLNEYFTKFGNIVNIQVSPNNMFDAAIIQFSTQEEARKAYSCPDAVLGNRFIKQFWHNPDNANNALNKNQNNSDQNKAGEMNVLPKPKPKPTMFKSGKTTFVRATAAVPAAPASSSTAPKSVSPKAQKILKTKEMMKKKLDIQKQKQELLEKQISQQKLLISKLEKAKNMSPEDRAMLMKSLKALTDSIDTLKTETAVSAVIAKSKENPVKARQAAQKEILDRELDIISHQHHGEDTTELRHKVEELKHEAQSLGLLGEAPARGRGRGVRRGTTRGRGRGRGGGIGRRGATVLDNRPKQLIITGFLAEEKDQVVAHFQSFGDVDRIEQDKTGVNMVLTYKTRKQAEIASLKGTAFGEKTLNISWYKIPPTSSGPASAPAKISEQRISTSDVLLEELTKDADDNADDKGEEITAVDEELLLGDDDFDEDDDEEERSWRR